MACSGTALLYPFLLYLVDSTAELPCTVHCHPYGVYVQTRTVATANFLDFLMLSMRICISCILALEILSLRSGKSFDIRTGSNLTDVLFLFVTVYRNLKQAVYSHAT
jgi:hypothetical protein